MESPMRPSLALIALTLTLLGCSRDDDGKNSEAALSRRGDAVMAAASTATTAPAAHPAASTHAAPRAGGKLCNDASPLIGKPIPSGNIASLSAPGATALPSEILTSNGRWTWVNLWAAWCEPCKEEIPLLLSWAPLLAQAGSPINLAFVSLDDDRRQAQRYLEEQPVSGLRSTFWLAEGKPRSSWLGALGLGDEPPLPLQLLLDPRGRVRCVIEGGVEARDFAHVQAVVSRR